MIYIDAKGLDYATINYQCGDIANIPFKLHPDRKDVLSPIRRARRAPPAGLASGAASPELRLWAGTQTRRIRPQPPAHVSAGEESAREPTSLTHFLGTHGVSLWECGDAKPSQGPLEPGALRAELCLGGQGTAEGALLLPFASL